MNPLDWTGPAFLQLYLVLLVLAVIAALAARWWMRQPHDPPSAAIFDLSPYEIAYLSGGERLAIDAAIVALIHREILGIDAPMKMAARTEADS